MIKLRFVIPAAYQDEKGRKTHEVFLPFSFI